jgi:hypothetical protein
MKKASSVDSQKGAEPDMLPEYRFDYSKARPNRFASGQEGARIVVVLDPDISEVFKTPQSVNTVLRALITTMPKTGKE